MTDQPSDRASCEREAEKWEARAAAFRRTPVAASLRAEARRWRKLAKEAARDR